MSKPVLTLAVVCMAATATFVNAAKPTTPVKKSTTDTKAEVKKPAKVRVPADHHGGIVTNMLVQTNQSKGCGWPVVLVQSEIPKSF
ncbi:MAG: hypothetical protein CMJ78_10705 [Planctomycetaceae bacterium]|nr:hypothetical protein [Planctomycetaceae bacterium]